MFVLAVGHYAALPQLAPARLARERRRSSTRENQIESTDPYVAELLLAALCGFVLTDGGTNAGAHRREPLLSAGQGTRPSASLSNLATRSDTARRMLTCVGC